MGQVFRAFDPLLQKHVAIKILSDSLSAEAKIRFQNEARVTARLNHPNIVSISDFGLTEDHSPYMVMEWVDGQNLSEYVHQQISLSAPEGLQIFFRIGAALAHAHGKGVIHRDLKPANVILLEVEGERSIKLVDFGIARLFETGSQSLTAPGSILGSPPYMSPEQCAGQTVDARSDIYSFGCLMYACLVGKPPLRGDTAIETMTFHRSKQPEPLTTAVEDVPVWLDAIVMKCLEKNPEDRYQNISSLLSALNEAYAASAIRTPEIDDAASVATTSAALAHKSRWPVGPLMILLVVSSVCTAWMLAAQTRNTPQIEIPKGFKKPFPELPSEALEGSKIEVRKGTIYGTGLTDETLKRCQDYRGHSAFDFLDSPEITGSGLKHLVELKPRSIKLRSIMEERNFCYFAQMPKLDYIKLDSAEILDGSGFAELRVLKNLNWLSLERCKLTNLAMQNIAQIEPLRILELKGSFGYDARGLSFLARRRLDVLDLTAVKELDDRKVAGLKDAHIDTLVVKNCSRVTDESLDVVKTITGLQTFVYHNTSITPGGASSMARALGFKHDAVTGTISKM